MLLLIHMTAGLLTFNFFWGKGRKEIGTGNAFCTLSRDLTATGATRPERQTAAWPLTAALFYAYEYFIDMVARFWDLLAE